ncbi:hypothetical protein ACWC9Q_10460 [Streptomyces sp. NPDC001142]
MLALHTAFYVLERGLPGAPHVMHTLGQGMDRALGARTFGS